MTSRDSQPSPVPSDDRDAPHLPCFRTWRGVYGFVLGCLVAYIVLFAVVPRFFA